MIRLAILILLVSSGLVSHANGGQDEPARKKAMMIIHADPGFPFYESAILFAKGMAGGLDYDLNVVYIPADQRDRFAIVDYERQLFGNQQHKPDIVISPFWLGAEHKLLDLLAEHKLPLISYNSFLSEDDLVRLGRPREKYPLWLGHLSPDDVKAGRRLARELLFQAKQVRACEGQHCRYNVFGFTGLKYAAVSRQRMEGLQIEVNNDKQARLINVVDGRWRQHIVAEQMDTIMSRHTDIDVFWAASDNMAFGVVDGLAKNQSPQHHRAVVGGMDWSEHSIELIRKGQLDVSLGGHFMEAGWALLMFDDYKSGIDFKASNGVILHTELSPINRQNIEHVGDFLASPKWSQSILKNLSLRVPKKKNEYKFNAINIVNEHVNTEVIQAR